MGIRDLWGRLLGGMAAAVVVVVLASACGGGSSSSTREAAALRACMLRTVVAVPDASSAGRLPRVPLSAAPPLNFRIRAAGRSQADRGSVFFFRSGHDAAAVLAAWRRGLGAVRVRVPAREKASFRYLLYRSYERRGSTVVFWADNSGTRTSRRLVGQCLGPRAGLLPAPPPIPHVDRGAIPPSDVAALFRRHGYRLRKELGQGVIPSDDDEIAAYQVIPRSGITPGPPRGVLLRLTVYRNSAAAARAVRNENILRRQGNDDSQALRTANVVADYFPDVHGNPPHGLRALLKLGRGSRTS